MTNNPITQLGHLISTTNNSAYPNASNASYNITNQLSNLSKPDDSLIHAPSLNFKLHKEVGGYVIEISKMNKQDYSFQTKLYVADENNFGKQIEKIIMIKILK